ncbi:SusC/RagA family TonB-linked outer membrane protein [Fulvitalea axinellae]|uniref:SusC/RagA family TonB-linked outer membrane protein n=1 Tax=Fulvitalea axinellae TaxID=1182444 RepID=A0AAU9CPJ6_9BACT|nr:SusC/RagA family TonB-linked outer membrane protein [Fulvitalea axinellae]
MSELYLRVRPKTFFRKAIGCFFITLLMCSLSAGATEKEVPTAETFTLSVTQGMTLKEALLKIRKKTGMKFFYKDNEVNANLKVDYDFSDTTISSIMDVLLKNTNLEYDIDGKRVYIFPKKATKAEKEPVPQQSKVPVKGTVKDDAGEPIIGANVVVKGTTHGSSTDIDGNFSLDVNPGDILQVSFVGFKPYEFKVTEAVSDLVVSLELDQTQLEEVVTIGYGVQKKKDLTGAVAQVSGSTLSKDMPTSITHSMAGRMPGVITTQSTGQPGLDAGSFSIRGKSTFGNNNALVLVDGIPRSWVRIDPNDIADIVILKDAASTAIYGARAANGVVLITTKQGEKGKAEISYSGSFSIQQATIEPELMNAYEYAKYFNEAKLNDGQNAEYTDEEVEKFRIGAPGYEGSDWWRACIDKSAPRKQHNLSVTGGGDKIRYFVSGNLMEQDGLLKSTDFGRYGIRSNISAQVTPQIKLTANLAYREEERNEPGKTNLWYNIGESLPTYSAYVNKEGVVKKGLGFNGLNTNPIGRALHSGYGKIKNSFYQSNLGIEYKVPKVEGLTLNGRFTYDKTFEDRSYLVKPFEFWVHDKTNDTYTSKMSENTTKLTKRKREAQLLTLMASVNYARTFGKHSVSVLALAESYEDKNSWIEAYREGFITDKIDQIFAGGSLNQRTGGSAGETARLGYAGRVSYSYDGKYLVQLNGRYDASYNFSKDNRWGFFPALSLGWRISDEPFLRDNASFISNLKLRASYGKVGNDRVPAYQYLSGFEFKNGYIYGGNYQIGINPTKLANPDITWEVATDYNIGTDFGIFQDRLYGSIEYFHKRTEQILLPRNASTPETFGADLPHENFGIVENKGLEAALNYRGQAGDLKWDLGGTFTWVKSKVIEIDEAKNVADRIKRTGRAFDQFYGYVSEGLFQNQEEIDNWHVQDGNGNKTIRPGDIKFRDISGPDDKPDGIIDGYDQQHIGKSGVPEIIYGMNLSLSYKNFSLMCNWQGAGNFEKYLPMNPFVNRGNSQSRLSDSWRPENPGAKYPRLGVGTPVNNARRSDFWLVDASYLKLRNLTVGYDLNDSPVLKYAGLKSVRVFFTGTNLVNITDDDYIDPLYPEMKAYTFGVNITL